MEVHSAVERRDFLVFWRPHPDFLAEPGVMADGVDACSCTHHLLCSNMAELSKMRAEALTKQTCSTAIDGPDNQDRRSVRCVRGQ